jgi:hypothetical protein
VADAQSELLLILKARDEASKVLQSATGNVEKYGWSFERILKPALLGIAAVTGIAAGAAVLFAKAAEDEQVASARLTQALRDTGAVFKGEAPQAVETFIASLEHMSGFSRIEVMDALALLVEQTGSYTEAMTRERVAADFARGANIDLWTASKLLGKVTDENVNVLARYGIHVAKGTSETELFAIVAHKFGGQAAAFGQTAAGQWAILGNRITDLRAKLGEALLPVLTQVAQRLTEFVVNVMQSGQVEKFAESIRSMADSFLEAATRVGAFFADISAVGLGDAIRNLIGDIVNKLREELPKLGAKLDSMGPIGVAIKIALDAAAVSLGLGFLRLFYGNIVEALLKVAGVTAFVGGTGGIGLAITAALVLGLVIDQVIGPEGENVLLKKLQSIDWWRVALGGIFVASVLLAAGAPILLAIPIAAVLAVTFETVFTGLKETQDQKNKMCEYALGPSAYWDGTKCVLPAQTISPAPGGGSTGTPGGPGTGTGGGYSEHDRAVACEARAWDGPWGTTGYYQWNWSDHTCFPVFGKANPRANAAAGGIVPARVGGTQVTVGEGGSAEAIIPLDGSGAGGALGGGGVTIENHFHGAVLGLDAVEDLIRSTIRDTFASGGFRGMKGNR